MPNFAYTVAATFTDPRIADEWITWLENGHIDEVLQAGALDAEIVNMEGETLTIEARYHFASRSAFESYEKDYAPRLRAEGMRKFPAERGIVYRRSTGIVRWKKTRDV